MTGFLIACRSVVDLQVGGGKLLMMDDLDVASAFGLRGHTHEKCSGHA
jgi:hypothetical protein